MYSLRVNVKKKTTKDLVHTKWLQTTPPKWNQLALLMSYTQTCHFDLTQNLNESLNVRKEPEFDEMFGNIISLTYF